MPPSSHGVRLLAPPCRRTPACPLQVRVRPAVRLGDPFPFGQALPAPGPVPSSWFLTTWTVSSTRMVRVCCAPLPTEVRRVSRAVGSIRVEPDGTARAIPATLFHTLRRTPLASSRTVSPRPLPSCRYRSFRHLRELPRAGAGSCTGAGRTIPAFLCPGMPCGRSDIAGIAGTTRFRAVNAGYPGACAPGAWPNPRPEGRISCRRLCDLRLISPLSR